VVYADRPGTPGAAMPSDTPTLPASGAWSSYEEGQVLAGKYRLERLLAQGGMGSVWRARNTSLDVAVAVKVVATAADREWLRPRFMREANAAARLRHPAIVRVFDVDQTPQGDPFIVMELLEGETLTKRMTPRLDPIEAVRLLLPIADALRVAHEGGVIHRDVKPENVFLALDGGQLQPKLLDFGIVKVDRSEGKDRLTERGEFVGTPEYMSPEQARGRDDLDATTDVWSLCVVLYEAITGRLPFQGGENYRALLRSIIEDAPTPISELGPEDAELAHIIERGLSKEPRERWLSMNELGTALALFLVNRNVRDDATGSSIEVRWLDRRPSLPSPQPAVAEVTSAASVVGVVTKLRRTQRRNRMMVGGVAVGAAAIVALLWLARPGAHAESASAASAPAALPPEPAATVPPVPTVTALVGAVASTTPVTSAAPPETPPAAPPKGAEPSTKPAKIAAPRPSTSAKVDAPLDLLDPY
jgi:serine/threonine protein kinase